MLGAREALGRRGAVRRLKSTVALGSEAAQLRRDALRFKGMGEEALRGVSDIKR